MVIICIILLLIFAISMIYEPRSFWNALLMMVTLCVLFLTLALHYKAAAILIGIIVLMIPLAFIFVVGFLIVNGIIMVKKEGRSLTNLLSLGLGISMLVVAVLTSIGVFSYQDNIMMKNFFYLVLMLEFYIAFTFVSLFIYSIIYTNMPKRLKCDYIIVHGCGLINGERISPLLRGRVDKAVEVYNKCSKSPKLVLSGGKGSDEKISEAEAMKQYLLENDFPNDKLIMEDKSTTTYENLKNVRDMLDSDGERHRYIFVTNNYHVFRTSLYARRLKMKAVGIGCKTASYYWPSAFIREYIAIMVKYKWIFAAIVIMWGILIALISL